MTVYFEILYIYNFGRLKILPPILGTLNIMSAKKSVPNLQDLVKSANEKYMILLRASCDLIESIKRELGFTPSVAF